MPTPGWSFESSLSGKSSLFERVRDNVASIWNLPRVALIDSGTQIHLLEKNGTATTWHAQISSAAGHVFLCLAIFWLFAYSQPRLFKPVQGHVTDLRHLRFTPPAEMHAVGIPSLGPAGNGGEHNPLPPTAGNLPPFANLVLAPPKLPDERQHELPVQSAILDADAPDLPKPVTDMGLPWMSDRNNSAGTGTRGIGSGPGVSMGETDGDFAGRANDRLPYSSLTSQVVCRLCPDPLYSDDARKQKLQGRVIMRVLVGADGRAHEVQVTRGLGMGLDENAEKAVRTWQFIPAKDASRHAVASWITIETVFRLF
jgi:protein TonB